MLVEVGTKRRRGRHVLDGEWRGGVPGSDRNGGSSCARGGSGDVGVFVVEVEGGFFSEYNLELERQILHEG